MSTNKIKTLKEKTCGNHGIPAVFPHPTPIRSPQTPRLLLQMELQQEPGQTVASFVGKPRENWKSTAHLMIYLFTYLTIHLYWFSCWFIHVFMCLFVYLLFLLHKYIYIYVCSKKKNKKSNKNDNINIYVYINIHMTSECRLGSDVILYVCMYGWMDGWMDG